MKRIILLHCFFLATLLTATAQISFNERYKTTVRGDMIVVGNNIIGPTKTGDYNGGGDNNSTVQVYVDIDDDPTTFNSSSAEVKDPNPGGSCPRKVKKAFLYWAGGSEISISNSNKVKFKVDNGPYQEVVGSLSFSPLNNVYIHVADVTDKLTNVAGTYTVANVQIPNGRVNLYAGWVLFIVYEDTSKPARNISLFDGYSLVTESNNPHIKISGFKTAPAPLPVNAKFAFAALDGDVSGTQDIVRITTNKITNKVLSTPNRPANNFFNSTITDENGINYNRKPKSRNTLGFDVGIFKLENANNRILGNDTTEATFYFATRGDYYIPYMLAFSIEVIEPNILMSKRVFNAANQDVTGKNTIALGETLRYEIKFQNQGNDNAKNLVITDDITDNLESSITNITPSDNKITTNYNPANRKLTISVPDELVKKNSKEYTVSFNVKVTDKCSQWRNPCANEIKNIAYASYKGELNNTTTFTPKSSSTLFTACGSGVEGPSNFIVDVDFSKCVFKNDPVVLCQPSLVLTAAAGFTSYTWSKVGDPSFSRTGAAITVTEAGIYKVTKSKTGCATMYEEFEVDSNDIEAAHPIEKKIIDKEISGEIYVCSSDGKKYPQVYLCGKDASLNIKLAIGNAESYVWEKMAATCPGKAVDCPASRPSQASCWSAFGTGAEKQITTAGDYRLTITYAGGCVVTYYFRVTKDDTELKSTVKHEVCNTKGSIIIDALGAGFKYALKQNNIIVKSWQTSPVFSGLSAGIYKVLATNPSANTTSVVTCIYEIEKTVLQKTPKLKLTVTNPLCKGGNGSLQVQLSDAPYYPYTYKVYKDNTLGALVEQKVITSATDVAATGFTKVLPAGIYVVVVENNDGCTIRATDKIVEPTLLKLDVAPHDIMCNEGTINVSAQGGTKDSNGYTFELYKAAVFVARASSQASHTFTITDKGAYTVKVIDAHNCTTETTVTIKELPVPTIGAITAKLYDCGTKVKIVFPEPQSTVSYTYEYNLTAFLPTHYTIPKQTGREFTNITPGHYFTPHIYYTYGGKTCMLSPADIKAPAPASGNLIASAGVAQLVGCGTGANAGKALVRFTNVQGGVGTVTYNFGDGVWTTTSSKWLAPGTYNLAAKDEIECIRDNLKVIVPTKIQDPIFTHTITSYTCEGKGTIIVNNDKNTYKYTYQLDNGMVTTSNVFTNVSSGIHTITIKYADGTPPASSELIKEDFGTGEDTCSANVAPTISCGPGLPPTPGRYVIGSNSSVMIQSHLNWWSNANDHTHPTNRKSRMLVIDIGNVGNGDVLYQKTVEIAPNRKIKYEMYVMNLEKVGLGGALPDIKIFLVNPITNAVIDQKDYGTISRSSHPNDWRKFSGDLNPGNINKVRIEIRTKSWAGGGCDMALDDIYVYQEPEACPFTQTVTVNIANDKAFGVIPESEQITNAKCSGDRGSYQIEMRNTHQRPYYVQKDNAGAFVPVTGDLFKWTNIIPGNHTVKFKGDLNNPNCDITRTFTITEPAPLQVGITRADGDHTIGCTPAVSAPQTIAASGGVQPYTFTIYKGTATLTVISAQVSKTSVEYTFTQTGDYYAKVTDANGCEIKMTTPWKIYDPKTLTLTGTTSVANNNYCMNNATAGKVEVQVGAVANSGNHESAYRNAPYTYKHNGVTKATTTATTYVFTNLAIGTHTFTVIDKYGCVASYTTEIKRMITADGRTLLAIVVMQHADS